MFREKRGAGLFAASVGIAAVVTAGFEPLEVLAGWLGATLLRLLLSWAGGSEKTKGTARITIGAGILITAGLVWAAEQAFPQESSFPFVSLCILLLLYRIMIGEKENMVITGNVLGLAILPLVAVIELFGVSHLEWMQTIPNEISGMHILIVLSAAAPWWVMGNKNNEWGWFAGSGVVAVVMSILTAGILGKGLRAHTDAPLYRAVQGIEIFGKPQRFEALLAAAILMGVFTAAILIGEVIKNVAETVCPEKYKRGCYMGILVCVFIAELIIRAVNTVGGIWYAGICCILIFLYGLWVVFSEKVEKSA